MKKQKYTVAVIGTGRIGFSLGFDSKREQPASHTMAVNNNKRLKLIAACDKDMSNLEYFKRFNKNVRTYSDTSLLFAAEKPDIVIIAVNEESHLDVSLSALKAGVKLIILEKPVALTVSQSLKIQEEALKRNIPVMVNHERRFSKDYIEAKKNLSRLGEIISVNARLDSGLKVYSLESEKNGGYSLLHDGTHLVDSVKFLLEGNLSSDSEFSKIALTGLLKDSKEAMTARYVSFKAVLPNVSEVNFQISGKSRYFGFEIDIMGTEGRLRIGNALCDFFVRKESKLYSGFYSLEKDKKIRLNKKTGYFSNMIQNAVDFLDGTAELKSPLSEGIKTLKVLEEVKKQIKNSFY